MRIYLTAEEQAKLNAVFDINNMFHYTSMWRYGSNIKKIDIVTHNSASDVSSLQYGNSSSWSKVSGEKTMSYDQLLDMLPSPIFCDREYNIVSKDDATDVLYLSIEKNCTENVDISFKYTVQYKSSRIKNFKTHRPYVSKNPAPVLHSDEPIECLYKLALWCFNHGHLLKNGKPNQLNKDKKDKKDKDKESTYVL